MDVPDRDWGGAGIFAVEVAGVEQFLGQDSLVALHLSVVARGVRLGLLMPRALPDDASEVAGSVTGAVVIRWMWVMPCAADQTLARARNAAAVVPFSSGNASV